MRAAERNEFNCFNQRSAPRRRHADRSEAPSAGGIPIAALSRQEFIPVVNPSTLSDRVSFWVMETACRQAFPVATVRGRRCASRSSRAPSQL